MIKSLGLAKCASRSSSRPSLWPLASCATTVVAATNCTEYPARIASRPSATARWVLPTPGGPSEQIRVYFHPADLDQAFAKVDLHLLAGRRFEPHRRPCLRVQLLPIRLHRPLDRAKADEDSLFRRQLLADHVGIAAMAAQPFPQPRL
jgi:hypothetical protein